MIKSIFTTTVFSTFLNLFFLILLLIINDSGSLRELLVMIIVYFLFALLLMNLLISLILYRYEKVAIELSQTLPVCLSIITYLIIALISLNFKTSNDILFSFMWISSIILSITIISKLKIISNRFIRTQKQVSK